MNLHTNILRILMTLALGTGLMLGALAAEDTPETLRVYTTEGADAQQEWAELDAPAVSAAAEEPAYHDSSDRVVDIIIRYEGFVANPVGGYIGYGSNYADAVKVLGEGCEPITKAQAEQVTRYQLGLIDEALNRFLQRNGIALSQSQYDALSDFTYGCGIGWTTYRNTDGSWCLLKQMLLDDPSTWTRERAVEAFGTWVRDGSGTVLPGLVRRRAEEAEWFLEDAEEQEKPVYSDVSSRSWYYDYVLTAKELGLMNGMGDGTFRPEKTLTRAELVQALANFAGAQLSGGKSAFSDVKSTDWYAPAVAWAAEKGYVTGFEDGTFRPNAAVTREQLCTILARYLQGSGKSYPQTAVTFTDRAAISGYAREYVDYCGAIGLVTGMEDGSFQPKSGANRAQAATILVRMAQLSETKEN